MNFWWVNHKQTFKHEFGGGYIWCPKLRADGHRNPYYEFIKLVQPGDLVFSYAFGLIQGIGIALSHCYTCPRPDAFGHVGEVWDKIGWRADVAFQVVGSKIKPKSHLTVIRDFLNQKHSPLLLNGNGRQAIYLTQISKSFAEVLAGLIGYSALSLVKGSLQDPTPSIFSTELKGRQEWEDIEIRHILQTEIPETVRQSLIKARLGQGRFKQNVYQYEWQCRITRVDNPAHLIASHIKPWRESNNEERLSAGNGLLLTPTIDHLFDRGFISFDDSGETLISPIADPVSLSKMGIDCQKPPQVGSFNSDQKFFLKHHRNFIFLNKS